MPSTSATVPSRAAVAGNPSDGFGGAVCSVVLPFFAATATIGLDVVAEPPELVTATCARFAASVGPVGNGVCDGVGVSIDTSIPRSVGLAGSSAIVIATLRALDQYVGSALSTLEIARLAHQVEREDLGIAGGWQDQIIQSHATSGLMEFGEEPTLTPLKAPDPPIPLYVAWSERAAEVSGHAHSDLRKQRDAADPVWTDLAKQARRAAVAISQRNVHELKRSIDETFDIRRVIMDIAPLQQDMIDTARACGASANFAGSGGAILGVLPKDGPAFLQHMRDAGYDVETWSLM